MKAASWRNGAPSGDITIDIFDDLSATASLTYPAKGFRYALDTAFTEFGVVSILGISLVGPGEGLSWFNWHLSHFVGLRHLTGACVPAFDHIFCHVPLALFVLYAPSPLCLRFCAASFEFTLTDLVSIIRPLTSLLQPVPHLSLHSEM